MADTCGKLIIIHGDKAYQTVAKDGVTYETSRKGQASILKFEVYKINLEIEEGDVVQFIYKDKKVFFGFIFAIEKSKDDFIKVKAYDQLRYLKNKDTFIYSKTTCTNLLKTIASKFGLNLGDLDDTRLPVTRSDDNKTLFDIIQNNLDETLMTLGDMYILYDDFGKLNLKDAHYLRNNLLICEVTAGDFNYKTSIDGDTYNQVKLVYENEEAGTREVYMAKDSNNINKWGLLQHYDTTDNPDSAAEKANQLLKLYNTKQKSLSIKNALGDPSVRAGFMLLCKLKIDSETTIESWMLIDKCKQTFYSEYSVMDLNLLGNVINTI